MLPPNIDLTSHGDFGHNLVNLIPQTPLDYDYDSENEKFDIFPNLRKRYFYEEDKEHCIRCGKVIRLPWKNYHGLCEECDGIVAKGDYPWDNSPTRWWDDKGYNLFNLR